MEIANTVIGGIITAAVGALVIWAMRGRFAALERELDARFGAVDHRLETVGRRLETVDRRLETVDRRLERVDSSMDALRSDLTQVALAVGARPRAQDG